VIDLHELLAEHYDIPTTATLVEIAEGVFRIGDVVLKRNVYAQREAEILVTLEGGSGYRVQKLVRTKRGEVAIQPGFLVTRWEQGTQKTYLDITEPEWGALGAELAALHIRLDAHTGDSPTKRTPIDLAEQRSIMATHKQRDNPAVASYLDTQMALLDRVGERAVRPPPVAEGVIHNDYNQYNYLFDGTLPPIILDWEGAAIAPREYEVVRCLNHLPVVAPAHATAFVEGYRSRRPLDRAGLRWGLDRALLDHALKLWPLYRQDMLQRSMEVLTAVSNSIPELERFFGVEAM
jgi:Ser/Thr protein kinase RdoA (MazF antagonist)